MSATRPAAIGPVSIGGYTLIELVMTIVIIGILAAVAAPRLFDDGVFRSRGFADQIKSALRDAQKLAIAKNRFVCVDISKQGIALSYDDSPPTPEHRANCPGASLSDPAGHAPYFIVAPGGISIGAATSFYFDGMGRPSAAQRIAVSGYGAPVVVEAETGYVH